METKIVEKLTSEVDVEVLLSDVVGGARKLASLVEIFEEQGSCHIKPKRCVPGGVWTEINRKVKEWNGVWSRKERSWIVLLDEKPGFEPATEGTGNATS